MTTRIKSGSRLTCHPLEILHENRVNYELPCDISQEDVDNRCPCLYMDAFERHVTLLLKFPF